MLRSGVTPALRAAILYARSSGGTDREIARACGHPLAVVRSVQDRVRTADEFAAAAALSDRIRAPRATLASTAWDIEKISKAIDAQLAGQFHEPVMMARRMSRNPAIFVARQNRVAPSSAVAVKLSPSSETNAQARAIANAARKHCLAPRTVLKGIHQTLVDHGIAVGIVRHEATESGGTVKMRVEEWPLQHVRWNESRRRLETQIEYGPNEPIVHGDGTWILFQKIALDPWARDGCVTPAGFIWAAHTESISSWAGNARAHGQSRLKGQLPEGVTLAREDGTMSPEAEHFWRLLGRLASGEDAAAIIPPGATVEFLTNMSTAWQVHSELAVNQEKAASRVYLGTDASLGSVGGAPGVDISMLFGVATTLVQGDFEAIEQGLNVGLYQPWTAVNYGSSKLAPSTEYLLPDPDAERIREESAKNRERFNAAIEAYKARGFVVDQDLVNALAAEYGIAPPTMVMQSAARIPLTLAPTDMAKVITVNEARVSQGLEPLTDERGTKFIAELEADAEADAEIAVEEAAPPEVAP